MRRALLLAVILAALGAAPAGASSTVTCSFSVHLAFERGISTPRSTGGFASDGPGTAACAGVMDGLPVAGSRGLAITGMHRPGRLSALTDMDCLHGLATMRVSTGLVSAVGANRRRARRISGALTVTRIDGVWAGGGEVHSGRSATNLVAAFVPDPGQGCWDAGVTGGTLHGRLTITR